MGFYYPRDYYTHQPAGILAGTSRLALGVKSLLKRVLFAPLQFRFGSCVEQWRPFGSGSLLDVGCGNGSFLSQMSSLGWRVVGIDQDPEAITVSKQMVRNAELHCGLFEDAILAEKAFALVNVSHTLEHVYDPVGFVTRARRLLEPRGKLVLAVPNFASAEARLFARRWRGLEIPRHLYHFSPASLRCIVKKAGLAVEYVRPQVLPMTLSESLLWCLEDLFRMRISTDGWFGKNLYLSVYLTALVACILGNWGAIELVAIRDS